MSRYLDIDKRKYNRLTAIKYLYTDKNRQAVWLWQCECGNRIERTGNTVRRNLTKSCGCLNKELIGARIYLNFGGRKHTSKTKQIIRGKLKGRKRNPKSVKKSANAIRGRKYTLEHRVAISEGWTDELRKRRGELSKGENNPNYKDGKWKDRATEREIAMASLEYKEWRRNIFTRDNYTCQICGERGLRLEADHIKSWVNFPKLRYNIDNGRTLCAECHKETENYGWKTKFEKLQGLGLLT